MPERISITAIASISPLGYSPEAIWENYLSPRHFITGKLFKNEVPVSKLSANAAQEISILRNSDPKYKSLDDSVLFAIHASRAATSAAGWKQGQDFGINIGSSRGATQLFEKHHAEFLETGKAATLASPTTTLGNISSWVAHDLRSDGPEISHSITCSTALHAILNGIAWIRGGMANRFLVGGSEAPLTDFTIAQMQAMKIYSRSNDDEFPCRALDFEKKQNTMVLGEGASVCCLEKGLAENRLAVIEGFGYATERLKHSTSISADAECLQKSMKMAIGNTSLNEIDAIVMHAPGTIAGDNSEIAAIRKVFGSDLPMLTTNKWKIGHTFGASGMLNVELAIMMMMHQQFISVPFAERQPIRQNINKVLVNGVGFGGNAVSILLSR